MPILVTFAELRAIFGIPYTRSWIRQLELKGKFPKHVPIGEKRIGWVEKEVASWVAARMKERESNSDGRRRWPRKRKP